MLTMLYQQDEFDICAERMNGIKLTTHRVRKGRRQPGGSMHMGILIASLVTLVTEQINTSTIAADYDVQC